MGPATRTKTWAPLAGPQSLGTKGPGSSQHFWDSLSSLGWEPPNKEGLHGWPSGTGPSVINPEKPLCDETRWCRGLRQVWEAQLGTFGLQMLPGAPWGPKLPHQAE